jgi:hypothetical protein
MRIEGTANGGEYEEEEACAGSWGNQTERSREEERRKGGVVEKAW